MELLSNRRRGMSSTEFYKGEFTGLLRGKFTDDSTEDDWWYKINSKQVSLVPYVNPNTKEFAVDISSCTSLYGLFENVTAIERIYELPVESKVTSTALCFRNCPNLLSVVVNGKNSTGLTKVNNMFRGTSNIIWVDMLELNTENVNDYNYMFYGSGYPTTIKLNFVINEGSNTDIMLGLNRRIIYLITTGGFKIRDNFSIRSITTIPVESVMVIINALEDRKGKDPKTFTLNTQVKDKLSEKQISIATDKNWIVTSD